MKRMTLAQFFKIARQAKWRIGHNLRTAHGACPLAYVTRKLGKRAAWDATAAFNSIGLPRKLGIKIVTGADSLSSREHAWLVRGLGGKKVIKSAW